MHLQAELQSAGPLRPKPQEQQQAEPLQHTEGRQAHPASLLQLQAAALPEASSHTDEVHLQAARQAQRQAVHRTTTETPQTADRARLAMSATHHLATTEARHLVQAAEAVSAEEPAVQAAEATIEAEAQAVTEDKFTYEKDSYNYSFNIGSSGVVCPDSI